MLEKKLFTCLSSKFSLYPRRCSCSNTFLNNSNNDTEYIASGAPRYLISPQEYFNSKQILSSVKDRIPNEYLSRKHSESLYVSDPSVARMITAKILPYLKNNSERVVAECTPGLGLVTRQLLKNNITPLKLFEPSPSFREQLKTLVAKNTTRVQLYSKNLFKLSMYSYADQLDNGNRVKKLLKNVPKKGWTEDPAISIIGPMVNNSFLKHVMAALSTQTSLFLYGRVEMFLIMKPHQYLVLSTEQDLYRTKYNYLTILFNLFFDYKILNKLPREGFLPWENSISKGRIFKVDRIDTDKLYLVHLVSKKDIPLSFEELLPFYIFLTKFFNRRARVIPTLEYCVPDCGVHVIIPQLVHEEYFKNIDIFTLFGELTPKQILAVFREMYKHPNYMGSPFSEIVDAELLKAESSEPSSMTDTGNNYINLHPEEQLDLEENFLEEDLNKV